MAQTTTAHPARIARSFVVTETNGSTHTLAYYVWEPVGLPSTEEIRNVICVHGLTRTGRDFDLLAAALAATGKLRVFCLDVVGRGNSSYLAPDSQEAYGYPLYTRDGFAFVEHLQLKTVDFWVGTSMGGETDNSSAHQGTAGGLIAMFMCATNPKIITHLVLNDIGTFVSAQALVRLLEYTGKDPRFDTFEEIEAYQRKIYQGFGDLPPEAWRHLCETSVFFDENEKKYRCKYDPRIAGAFTAADVDVEQFFAKIESDILLLRGEKSDILRLSDAEKMAKINPHLILREFQGMGHAPSLMMDDQIDAVREWILQRL